MAAGPTSLNAQQQQFTGQSYYIYSWQYNVTNQNGVGCAFTDPNATYSGAQNEASHASPWIGRFDVWTNGAVDDVC